MKKKEPIVVYWSPAWNDENNQNWNFFYKDPEQLYKNLHKKRYAEKIKKNNTMLSCPVVSKKFKQTYVLLNPIKSHIVIDKNMNISYPSLPSVGGSVLRTPSFENNILLRYFLNWIFFTEEENLEINFLPPYFHKPQHLNYGAIVPGSFNIGKWFRQYNTEFNLWDDINEIIVNEDEPLMYVEFITDRPIVLKRFINTDKIHELSNACADVSKTMGVFQSLEKRYNTFIASRSKDIVLKEIKRNLID
jgi:hypothetical protein